VAVKVQDEYTYKSTSEVAPLGLQILDMMGKKINKQDDVKDVTSEEVKPTDKK